VLIVPDLIDAATVEEARAAKLTFSDGAATAGAAFRAIKHNLEAKGPELGQKLARALTQHREVALWALPARVTPFVFNRYEAGMWYGDHVDNAIGAIHGHAVRSDLAVTLFLSDDYAGGELTIDADDPTRARRVKLPRGHAVIYSAASIHRVEPITDGVRLAAVAWIQSLVADGAAREVLYDLACAARECEGAVRLKIEKARANLLRRWARP
jgi:PKHD-type hydroxylase